MTTAVSLRQVDRLAAAIEEVRRTCDSGSASAASEAQLELSLSELDAALLAIRNGAYRPSQRDAVAALELAVDLVRTGQEAGQSSDCGELEGLIGVGLERLKRMGL